MASTVEQGVMVLHGRLTPTATETASAKSHHASIYGCLRKTGLNGILCKFIWSKFINNQNE